MSKKHFIQLAAVLKSVKPQHTGEYDDGTTVGMIDQQTIQWRRDIEAVADACAANNDLFNRSRFLSACGLAV